MAIGRPPKPIEHHRRVGRGGDKKADGRPIPGNMVVLPMAEGAPPVPTNVHAAGAELWRQIWHEAITWISPHTDMAIVIEACHAADDLEEARRAWRLSLDPKDARVLVAMGKRFTEALSVLGFNPVARSRLGVAEVKKASALQQMMDRRAARNGAG